MEGERERSTSYFREYLLCIYILSMCLQINFVIVSFFADVLFLRLVQFSYAVHNHVPIAGSCALIRSCLRCLHGIPSPPEILLRTAFGRVPERRPGWRRSWLARAEREALIRARAAIDQEFIRLMTRESERAVNSG